jgi:hypothetical protein
MNNFSGLSIDNFPKLDANEIYRVREYLENPIRNGVWFLNFNWTYDGGITYFIEKEIEGLIAKKEILGYTNHFSFLLGLFSYIYLKEVNSQIEIEDIVVQDKYLPIIQVLNIEKLKQEYQDAYEIFKNDIYFNELYHDSNRGITETKSGPIVSIYNEHYERISLCALTKSPLEKIKIFFEKIGKITNSKIRHEYTPQETIFKPYFSFLEIAFPNFILSKNDLFSEAFNEYREQKYESCVIILGKIAEYYLKQIYETFHRDFLPKNSTMGDTYSSIDNIIKNLSKCDTVTAPNIKLLFDKVNTLLSDKSGITEETRNQKTLELIREVLVFINEDRKYTTFLIEKINKKETKISLFPDNINSNIKELIAYRNATAHNLNTVIGDYESQRMAYCCITLIIWWENIKDLIDSEEDHKILIEKIIEVNKISSRK